jgi:hypothetical protein
MILFLLLPALIFAGKSNNRSLALKGSAVAAKKYQKSLAITETYTNIIYTKWLNNKTLRFKHIPNPYIPIALAWSESSFNPKAKSISNCRGLFQLETRTAVYICKKYKIKYNKSTIKKDLIEDVYFNIEVGLAALNEEFKASNGSMKIAILSYKCGRTTIQNSLFISFRQEQLYTRYLNILRMVS